ncbi:hypothetical protein P691DRAFT_761988 [Macrolepiota fuliginosa MF-IS2]|uniref:Nephrocystin 3-like N-terminal domain-containing protein n=1 Tax=Macrolepiota fuliginosa MF-IS2 TaxID=1400762 RepID=A0A9P6C259_9AGAR|nr:hypothetical protein P691DRAFT_761988 [Macrolepiota fuliginosa MF-IS2]
MFDSSREFVVNGGTFIDNSHPESGLERLYQASMPEAALDSSAREYAAKCYPGTRAQRIQEFVSWASAFISHQDRRFRMTWMSGPAGVGKSALAQTCAETLGDDAMGAAFFFSCYNRRDDPSRLVPTIAYQIAMKIKPVATILDEKIREDPSLLSKTIQVQFRELVVAPLLELKMQDEGMRDRLVIIDGLDECSSDDARNVIVETIATAIRQHGDNLPLLWAFFSRPEPQIVRMFSSTHVSPFCLPTTLPISGTAWEEMELYLRGRFDDIKKQRPHLPSLWPSGGDISILVNRSNGFFAYASTATKFIGDPEALDPEERLRIVLSLSPRTNPSTGDRINPMAELDMVYLLLMHQIPKSILPITLAILLSLHPSTRRILYPVSPSPVVVDAVPVLANFLGLTFQSFSTALYRLHSVLRLGFRDETPWRVIFEHASFMEFLVDPGRCGSEFWIKHPRQYNFLAKRSMERLVEAFEMQRSSPWHSFPSSIKLSAYTESIQHVHLEVRHLTFKYCQSGLPKWLIWASMDDSLAAQLACFDFREWWGVIGEFETMSRLQILIAKIPSNYREQIIRRQKHAEPVFISQFKDYVLPKRWRSKPIYIIGQGEASVLLKLEKDGRLTRVIPKG